MTGGGRPNNPFNANLLQIVLRLTDARFQLS
jgi:hypothetical protein